MAAVVNRELTAARLLVFESCPMFRCFVIPWRPAGKHSSRNGPPDPRRPHRDRCCRI